MLNFLLGGHSWKSVLPELGNLLAKGIGVGAHQFNIVFLALGITGVGMALYLGYRYGG